MVATRSSTPFNPLDYAISGTLIDLTRGMQEALWRWDEINVMAGLLLPAFLREGRAVEDQHDVPMFAPSSLATFEVEDEDATLMACELIQRAYDDGHDAGALLNALAADLHPHLEAAAVQFKQRQPTGLLMRAVG